MQMKRLFEDSWSDPSGNPMSSDEENELDEALVEGVDSDFDDDADYDVVTVDPTVGHVDRSDLSAGSAEQHSCGEESVPPPCLTRCGAAGSARMPQHEERERSPIPERSRSPSPARRQTHGRQPRRTRRAMSSMSPLAPLWLMLRVCPTCQGCYSRSYLYKLNIIIHRKELEL